MTQSVIPSVSSQDSDDIRWALETATTLWEQGDLREALRWVRRAAEAAAESGADSRALELAKSGAQLRKAAEMPRTLPPPDAVPDGAPHKRYGDGELVVTVVAGDTSEPLSDASFVSHRALRVAVTPLPGHDGEFIVRPLRAGEVASKESTVGLLVALEPGLRPLSEKQEKQEDERADESP